MLDQVQMPRSPQANPAQPTRLQRITSTFQTLGLPQAALCFKEKFSRRSFANFLKVSDSAPPYKLHPKNAQYPLLCRPNTSDIFVFDQIFIEREYSCLDHLTNVDLILDCGANVGYSSAYFLSRFPAATIIAIEPDPANFAQLEKNLAPYGDRTKIIYAGLWSHPANLKIQYATEEWGTQVRECHPNETPDLQATDIATILRLSGKDRISILKVDIEGAEAIVFSQNYESWLPKVDNLVIELHDNSNFGQASEIFFNAIADQPFNLSECGELIVCTSKSALH